MTGALLFDFCLLLLWAARHGLAYAVQSIGGDTIVTTVVHVLVWVSR